MKNPHNVDLRAASKLAASARQEAIVGKRMPSVPELTRVLAVIGAWSPYELASADTVAVQLARACFDDLAAALRSPQHDELRELVENAIATLSMRLVPTPGGSSSRLAA